MDQKTLEYMGERVDKAREIQKKVIGLKSFVEVSDRKEHIKLLDIRGREIEIDPRIFERLALRAKEAILNEVHEEIKLLEQELAEL